MVCTLQWNKMITESWRKVKERDETWQKFKVWNVNGSYIYPVHLYLKNKRKEEPCKANEGTMWGRKDNSLIPFHYLFI